MHKKYLEELSRVLKKAAKDPALLHAFLDDLFTPAEYEEIVKRWQIVKLLHEGVPQRDVSEQLGVSVATVTRGSRCLRNPKGGFNRLLKKKK